MASIEPRPQQMQKVFATIPQGVPVVMLNMLRFRETAVYPDERPAVSGRQAYAQYSEVAFKIVEKLGGSLVWFGEAKGSAIGPPDEDWDHIFLVRYPSIEAFMEMIRSAAYQDILVHRAAALEDSRLIAMVERGA